jgi:hypothetical protein
MEEELALLTEMKKMCVLYLNHTSNTKSDNPVVNHTKQLCMSINSRLVHFCDHKIIEDIIEIGDKTKKIYYCSKCETTFN